MEGKALKILLISLFLFSCSHNYLVKPASTLKIESERASFDYNDVSGKYVLEREVKRNSKKVITYSKLSSYDFKKNKLVEKSVTISSIGTLTIGKRKKPILRPYASQYSVWFDGKEFLTQLKINPKKKSLDVYLKSPEKKWNGKRSIRFPKGEVFCFFSQLPECIKGTEFFYESIQKQEGSLKLYVIWDSFPYYEELYGNIKATLFTESEFVYDGKNEEDHRFKLMVKGQVLFYQFRSDLKFDKLLWVSQGMRVIRR